MPHLFTSRDVVLRDDDREWSAVAQSLGVTSERLRLVKQVHGVNVAVARRGEPWPSARPQADIVIANDPSIAIGVRTADCAAILLYDRARNVAGAAHAGWRGTAAHAAVAAVRAMQEEFGTTPRDLVAAIGPSLGQCCGEVGPEVVEAFRAGGADANAIAGWFTPGNGDRSLLDLERANAEQLQRAGVGADSIFTTGLCTKTHPARFHSYRAHGPAAGRMLGAIRCAS